MSTMTLQFGKLCAEK